MRPAIVPPALAALAPVRHSVVAVEVERSALMRPHTLPKDISFQSSIGLRLRSSLLALAALFAAAVAPPAAAIVTKTVCAGGGCDFTTIQAAINAGLGPDTMILVSAGTYRPTNEIDINNDDSGTAGHPAILKAEPRRDSRRLHTLRGWGHGTKEQVLPGGPRAGGPHGPGPCRAA